jgi:integrase
MTLRPETVRDLIRKSGDKQQWHSDGRSLFLVTRQRKGFWVLHFRDPREGGAIRNAGLGSADDVTPAAARRAASDFMSDLRNGRPVALATRKAKGEPFAKAATAWLDNHADEWSPRTRSDNKSLFARYLPDTFNAKPVTAITADDVAAVLRPIWAGPGNDKANRLRRMVEDVLSAKDVHPNPARWDGGPLSSLLSRKRLISEHRKSMPWRDVPAFFASKLTDSMEDRAGRFAILTTVRRKEVLCATWGEFDIPGRVWTIPGVRMKKPGGKVPPPHSVPLTDAMIETLGVPGERDAYVFPSSRTGRKLGNKALDKQWLPVDPADGKPYTLHGFRTSCATWAEEHGFAPNLIESALAHAKGNATTQAYLRSDLFEARRKLMEAWSKYVSQRA